MDDQMVKRGDASPGDPACRNGEQVSYRSQGTPGGVDVGGSPPPKLPAACSRPCCPSKTAAPLQSNSLTSPPGGRTLPSTSANGAKRMSRYGWLLRG